MARAAWLGVGVGLMLLLGASGLETQVRRVIAPGISLYEGDGVGAQSISILPPASLSADRTCTLQDGAAPIPDSCVGDGSDGGDPWTRQTVTSDLTTTNAVAYTAISDLDFAVAANTSYRLRCVLMTESANVINGLQLQTTGPAAPTEVTILRGNTASTTLESQIYSYAFQSSSTDDGVADSCGAAERCINELEMILVNGANAGTVAMAFQSEAGGISVSVHAGSWCEWMTF